MCDARRVKLRGFDIIIFGKVPLRHAVYDGMVNKSSFRLICHTLMGRHQNYAYTQPSCPDTGVAHDEPVPWAGVHHTLRDQICRTTDEGAENY